jgi:malate dehydrogenase (oxaloacetate-decarboxylating)
MVALRISKIPLTEMRLVVFGSGSAGMGIADQVVDAIVTGNKRSKEEALKQIWYVSGPIFTVRA